MNLDELTIGQAKELAAMFGKQDNSGIGKNLIGKYVIVRSRNEGINAGTVVEMDDTGIVLKDARRIWYHRPADKSLSWYEGVAISGLDASSKISAAVDTKAIFEDYSITVCTPTAEISIREHKAHAQN